MDLTPRKLTIEWNDSAHTVSPLSLSYYFLLTIQGTQICMDPNQNPFAGYTAAPAVAPPAPAPAPMAPPPMAAPPAPAPAPAAADPNAGGPAGFGSGPSLDYVGGGDPNAKVVRLRDRLNEADTERRKEEDEADRRERAAEIRREERQKKIKYMADMPDSQPAGTVEEFMFKEGVQDQLDKLDRELIGLVPVKKRVKVNVYIASALFYQLLLVCPLTLHSSFSSHSGNCRSLGSGQNET